MKKQLSIDYDWFNSWKELNEQDQTLVKQAVDTLENAYAPYSQFHVGASLSLQNGHVITGNNQENIAYPSGICAERVAVFYANSQFPEIPIQTIVITAKGNLVAEDSCISPCGSCRQVIAESERRQNQPIRIILVAQNEQTWVFSSIHDLLVFPFGIKA